MSNSPPHFAIARTNDAGMEMPTSRIASISIRTNALAERACSSAMTPSFRISSRAAK